MVIIIEKTSSAGANFAYARGVLSASTRRDTRDFAQESVLRTVDWLQNQLVLWAFMTAKCARKQNRRITPISETPHSANFCRFSTHIATVKLH